MFKSIKCVLSDNFSALCPNFSITMCLIIMNNEEALKIMEIFVEILMLMCVPKIHVSVYLDVSM